MLESSRARTWLIALFFLLAACTHPRPMQAPESVKLTPLKTIPTIEARLLLTLAGVKGISVNNAVDLYRMQYHQAGGSLFSSRFVGAAEQYGTAPSELQRRDHDDAMRGPRDLMAGLCRHAPATVMPWCCRTIGPRV